MKNNITPEEFEAAYIKYACDEVSHNTMTRGEFSKHINTDKEFHDRFFPNYLENTFDWTYNNETEIE